MRTTRVGYRITVFTISILKLFEFQLDVDVGSSTVARGVVSLVLGYLNNLVIEMAFLIQVKPLFSLLQKIPL